MDTVQDALRRAGISVSPSAPPLAVGKRTIDHFAVSGREAIATWFRLRKAVPKTGRWPVLLGSDEELEMIQENLEDGIKEGPTPAKVLAYARRVNTARLFDRWQKIVVENAQEALAECREDGVTEVQAEYEAMLAQEAAFRGMPRGPWPEGDFWAADEFSIPYDILTKVPHNRVHIGLLPTANSWDAAAFLLFGSWNACPHAHHHVAIMKAWHERYGAEVVGITHDIVEMFVRRPPRSKARALELAREHYLYCDDIVDQGTQTIDKLAATLRGGTVWYFWWD
jgi:hypothetical protein